MRRRAFIGALAGALGAGRAAGFTLHPPVPIAFSARDREGASRNLAELGGRLTLVHFWASWCGTCRNEFPALDGLQRDFRDQGLRVVAVSIDRLGWPVMDKVTTALGVCEVTVLHDRNREAAQALRIIGVPTTVVADHSGREIARIQGTGDWAGAALRGAIGALLTQG